MLDIKHHVDFKCQRRVDAAIRSPSTVSCMHASMSRLLNFARDSTKNASAQNRLHTWPDIERRLGITSAVVSNWKMRGISKPGAFDAQRILGCNAWWLLDGEGAQFVSDPDPTIQAILDAARQLPPNKRGTLLTMAEALLPEESAV
jgi:hypothetical protein